MWKTSLWAESMLKGDDDKCKYLLERLRITLTTYDRDQRNSSCAGYSTVNGIREMSRVLVGISSDGIMSQPSSPLPIGDHSSASVNDSLRSRTLINSHWHCSTGEAGSFYDACSSWQIRTPVPSTVEDESLRLELYCRLPSESSLPSNARWPWISRISREMWTIKKNIPLLFLIASEIDRKPKTKEGKGF